MKKEDKELLAKAGVDKIQNTKVLEIVYFQACCCSEIKCNELDFKLFESLLLSEIQQNFSNHSSLMRIKRGERVSDDELEWLDDHFITNGYGPQLYLFRQFFPESTADLDQILRTIIGMDAEAIEHEFTTFFQKVHMYLNSKQQRFIGMLKNHLCQYGSVDIEQLYDAPFNQIDDAGLDGVFPNPAQADVIEKIVSRFSVHLGNKQARVEKTVN